MSPRQFSLLLSPILLCALAAPAFAQVDEAVVASLPSGGGTALLAEASAVAPVEYLMAVEYGAAITCELLARLAGPGAFTPSQTFIGSSAAFSPNSRYLLIGDPTGASSGGTPVVQFYADKGSTTLPDSFFQPGSMPFGLHPTDPSPGTEFGAAVAVSGDIAVVGSPGSDEAFIYRDINPPTGQWVLEHTWTGLPGDRTGTSVAADDQPGVREQVIIGSPLGDDFAADGGRADILVYDPGSSSWILNSAYWSLWPAANYGLSVDIDGDAAIVGAPTSPFGGGGGLIDTLRWNGGWFDFDAEWYSTGVGDRFGEQVSILGDTAVVGAPSYDGFSGGLPDPGAIPDRGGAVLLKDNGFDYDIPSGNFFYTLSDFGNGVPTSFASFSNTYDGYDRLVYAYADDGVDGYVLEYRLSTVSWVWADEGNGLAGVTGEPVLVGEGSLWPTEPVRLTLMNSVPNGLGFLMYGLVALNLPFKGGVVVPQFFPPFGNAFPWPLSPLGDATLTVPLPPSIALSGLDLYLQTWVLDAAGPVGYAASNAIKGSFP